jgi:exodeoxyribonuclease V alpha subunit
MSPLTIEALEAAELLAPLDIHLVRTLGRLSGGVPTGDASGAALSPLAALGIAVTSRAVRAGHVCVDLPALGGAPVRTDEGAVVEGLTYPDAPAWRAALAACPVVGPPESGQPVVMDAADRLYLRRFWSWQCALSRALSVRARAGGDPVDGALLRAGLDRLFPSGPPDGESVDWQRIAAQLAVLRRFCVVSGGPGTGKTSTVVKMLALLVEQALAAGRTPPAVMLVAPTGKAAARLTESIRAAKAELSVTPEVRDAIPEEARTIHRALGVMGGATTRFRHDADRPLAADVVLVDEASMVDLALMTRLVAAVPARARLILLGDKDQLASVEAGAVLGDVCNAGAPWSYSQALAAELLATTGDTLPTDAGSPAGASFGDAIVHLRHSYRFGSDSGVAALARAINAGDTEASRAVLADPAFPDVVLGAPLPATGLGSALRGRVIETFRAVLSAQGPAAKLKAFGGFRVLAAHRAGPTGVAGLNQSIERALSRAGLLHPRGEWYDHRPVMVLENDYQVGLFNGDVGMILDLPGEGRVAVFVGSAGEVRTLAPARLPAHQTVFAMTVHKSQGSEFTEVALVLPRRPSPVTTRELVYTGVTRAREIARVYGDVAVLDSAVGARVVRASGLRAALWGPG